MFFYPSGNAIRHARNIEAEDDAIEMLPYEVSNYSQNPGRVIAERDKLFS